MTSKKKIHDYLYQDNHHQSYLDKKYNNLIDNSQSLEKKRQAIEKDIDNTQELQRLQAQKLSEIIKKRK